MRALFLFFGLLSLPTVQAGGFPGGQEALVAVTTDWIANDQSLHRDLIEVTPPDRRIPIANCQSNLAIRFPFTNNQKTIEVVCKNPSWKRYLRVKIEQQRFAWTFTQNLVEGTEVHQDHVVYQSIDSVRPLEPLSQEEILGRVVRENVSEGDVVTPDLLGEEIAIYIPNHPMRPEKRSDLKIFLSKGKRRMPRVNPSQMARANRYRQNVTPGNPDERYRNRRTSIDRKNNHR